jgi:hypothetical protein
MLRPLHLTFNVVVDVDVAVDVYLIQGGNSGEEA